LCQSNELRKIFWPLLCALLAFNWITSTHSATIAVAYYGASPGDRAHVVRYAGDAATQTVRMLSSFGPGTMTNCTVLDARNWSCPGPSAEAVGAPSSIDSDDGKITVSNPKILIAPESWLMWKSARIFGPIAKVWGAT